MSTATHWLPGHPFLGHRHRNRLPLAHFPWVAVLEAVLAEDSAGHHGCRWAPKVSVDGELLGYGYYPTARHLFSWFMNIKRAREQADAPLHDIPLLLLGTAPDPAPDPWGYRKAQTPSDRVLRAFLFKRLELAI